MKKVVFFMTLVLAVIQAKADLAPTVMLHHNGQAKYYMYYQIQNAVDEAVDGDTIYLSEGTFQPFNVNKRIMVRGAGSTTIIEGDCEIDISGTAKLTMPVLDAMCFTGTIFVKSAYKQFTLRKCRAQNIYFTNSEYYVVSDYYDVKLEQCFIQNYLLIPEEVKEINVFNSKIQVLYPYNQSSAEYTQATFEHCNIVNVIDTIQGAVFNSCYIYKCGNLSGAKSRINLLGCILNSCAYGHPNSGNNLPDFCFNCTFTNCSDAGSASSIDYYYTNKISAIDGTPIGAYGGQHPYTLWPEVPGVTQYKMSIDAATKTMNVKLTVDKLVK